VSPEASAEAGAEVGSETGSGMGTEVRPDMGPAAAPEPALGWTGDRPRVMLLTRPACHLCGPVRAVVSEVCLETGDFWVEANVDDDAELRAEYGEQIPVVLVDDRFLASFTVDADELRRALKHGV